MALLDPRELTQNGDAYGKADKNGYYAGYAPAGYNEDETFARNEAIRQQVYAQSPGYQPPPQQMIGTPGFSMGDGSAWGGSASGTTFGPMTSAQQMADPRYQQAQQQPSGGASFGGSATAAGGQTTGNPYMTRAAQGVFDMANQNLSQNVMPQIRSGFQAAGQYGSARQGIAEGVAAGNSNAAATSTVAGMMSGQYNTDQANILQRLGLTNNFNLGMGSLALQNQGQNQNFYTNQRGQDLQQYGLGSSIFGAGVTGQAGLGQGQYTTGQTFMNAPLNPLQQYVNTISPFSGLGSPQVNTGGGGLNGAIGGALAGAQIAQNLGLGNTVNSMGNSTSNAAWYTPATRWAFGTGGMAD